jgi:hypothetical protein
VIFSAEGKKSMGWSHRRNGWIVIQENAFCVLSGSSLVVFKGNSGSKLLLQANVLCVLNRFDLIADFSLFTRQS